jgi:hypothetical protein
VIEEVRRRGLDVSPGIRAVTEPVLDLNGRRRLLNEALERSMHGGDVLGMDEEG